MKWVQVSHGPTQTVSPETFPKFNYVAPKEICVERKCFDSPIKKWGSNSGRRYLLPLDVSAYLLFSPLLWLNFPGGVLGKSTLVL